MLKPLRHGEEYFADGIAEDGITELSRTRKQAFFVVARVAPGTTIAGTRAGVPWKNAADMERYADGLRRAGLPE